MSSRVPSDRAHTNQSVKNTDSSLTRTPEETAAIPVLSPGMMNVNQWIQMQRLVGNQAMNRQVTQQQRASSSRPIQRAGGGTPKSPLEQRTEELGADCIAVAPTIAQEMYTDLVKFSGEQMQAYLIKDKQMQALRDSLNSKARGLVEDNIDTISGEDHQLADAKRHAEENVAKAKILEVTIKKFAEETINSELTSSKQSHLETKARDGYNIIKANPSTSLEKQKNAARSQAKKTAYAEYKRIQTEALSKVKQETITKVTQDAKFLDGTVEVGDLGKSEANKRIALEAQLVQDADVDTVYTNKLYDPIKEAVLMKLGVGRGAWRRSDELNEFREKMKASAREQANTEIDSQISTNTSITSAVGKKYKAMIAKKEAYKMAKGSVDSVMEKEAIVITDRVLPAAAMKKELQDAAQSSAYDVARNDANATKKIREAALSGARKKAIELLKANQTKAVNEARKITKGDKATAGSTADTAKQDELSTEVKDQITTDRVAEKAIHLALEAKDINSGLAKIGKILDLAAPNPGDTSSYEFELKIPVHESGVYVLFGLAGEASRELKELTVSTEITFGAGFHTFGFDANFRAGFYLESQSKDSKGVMNLISYGMYRELRVVAPKAADYFWGQGGKSGMEQVEEAELWAAMIEEQDLNKEGSHVDIGLVTRLQAEANAGVAEMGGTVGYKLLSRFDKEAIDRIGGSGFGDTTDLTKLKEKAKRMKTGATRQVFDATAEAKVKIGGTSIGFALEGEASVVNWRLRAFEISAKGTIPFQFGEEAAEWAQIAAKVATPIAGASKNVFGIILSRVRREKDADATNTGSVADAGTDVLFTVPQFDEAGKSLAESIQGDETVNDTIRGWLTGDSAASAIEKVGKVALASQLDLSIGFSKEWGPTGMSKGWEIYLEVGQTKKFEIDAEFVKFGVEKSKRLGKLAFGRDEGGGYGVSGEVLGMQFGG